MSGSTGKLVVVAAVLLGTVALGVSEAQAGWGWRHWGACYTPCWSYGGYYTPCYSYTYSSCCYSSGWYLGCELRRYHAVAYWPCTWYSCASPCYDCCWDVVCGEAVEVTKPTTEPTPAEPPSKMPTPAPPMPLEPQEPEPEPSLLQPVPAPAQPGNVEQQESGAESQAQPNKPRSLPQPPMPGTVPPSRGDNPDMPDSPPVPAQPAPPGSQTSARVVPGPEGSSGVIGVWVPAEARVIINGRQTKSTGTYREYISRGLKPGFTYRYQVRAQIVRDGRLIESTRIVSLTAGVRKRVAFEFEAKPEEAIAALW